MKKDINIEILNSQNGVIKFNLPQEIKGMKIIDSFLETTVNNVNSNNSYNVKFNCYKVINGIETDIRNDEDTFVDVIKFPNQKLSINISDELQFAIDSEADSLKFTLVNGEALNFSEAFNLKTEYILKTSYKDNASYHNVDLGRSGTASINLSTGDLDIKLPLVSSDKNVLPLAINANYSSVKNEKLPEIGLPNKWSFNLNQFLIEHKDQEKLLFSYIDENSKEHIIEEKYYYKDDNNEEQIVSRENLTLDLDGRLIYNDNGKERLVNTKLEAPSGIKLVSSIGTEHEPEELINIREVIESLENNNSEIENNLYSLKINIFTQCLNSYLSRLQLNLQYLSENDNSDDKSHIEEVIKAIKNKIYSLAIGKEKIIGILKEYIGEEDYNFIFTDNNEIDRIFNEFCESSEIKKTILNEYVVCGSNTEAENSSGIQTINSSFHNTIPNLIDVNCFYTDKNIETYVIQYKKYNEQLESNVNNLKEYKHQKDLYEMRIPVHYLYNDSNVFYGFGKTSKDGFDGNDKVYRLILITDSYENMISIDYESFEDNKVKSIVDSANKTINFDYDVDDKNTGEKYKCIITDSRDRKVKIKEVNSGLRIIHVDGESSNFYFGDKHIIKVLNQNGLGVNFTYDNDKVSSISQISALVKDENGKIKLNNELNFNVVPIDSLLNKKDTITFSYNNYMSTTITNAKNKKITYLFDKYGKVKTQYESFIKQRESQENGESAIIEYISREVALFDYKDTKVNRKIKNLPYSKNYLHGAVFTNSNEIAMAEDYFGETYCSEDVYATDYSIFENSHVMSSSNQEVKDSLTMCQDMIDELNDRNSFCSHRTFVVTGWALANSAFIVTDEEESFPEYITKRTFGLLVKVTYEDGEVAQFKQSFDWRNIDWQLCAVPVSLADKNISGIECTISYSYNTGNIVYTDLEFKEATYDEIIYDSLLRPKTIKSAHSEWQTMLEYDGDTNNILRETFKKVDSTTQEELESFDNTYIYNKEGKLIKSINYNGIVNEQVYNDKGQVIKTMTYHKDEPATKFYEEKILDEKGNHLNEVNGLGQTTNNYKYVDGTGIVENITDENGVKVSYGYDEADTLLQMTSTIDNMTNTNIYGYELDHLTSLKHNDFEIGYKYDIWGRLFKIQIANNDYLTKTYKDNEETTELVVDETTKLTFKQTFNDDNQVVDTYMGETLVSSNVYDAQGKVECTKDFVANITTNIIFDNFGNTTKANNVQHGNDVVLENSYDTNNHKILKNSQITIGDKKIRYDYNNSSGQLESRLNNLTINDISNEGSEIDIVSQNIIYDKLGRVSLIKQNNVAKNFEYLSNGDHTTNLVSKISYSVNEAINDNLKYKYDSKGNIIEVKKNNNLIARYKYDALSRIVREDNKEFNKTIIFEYDAGGNITTKTEFSFCLVENLEHFAGNQIVYKYPLEGWKDKLLSYNNEKFNYDNIGNPTIFRDKELIWSRGRQLDYFDVTKDSEGNITDFKSNYIYNANGIRTKKIINVEKLNLSNNCITDEGYTCDSNICDCENNKFTTYFTLDGNKILQQKDCCNVLDFYYGVDGILGFHLKNNVVDNDYFYKKNAQNDIIGIYDVDGLQIVKYKYDAWGNQKVEYLDSTNNFVAIEDNYEYNDTSNINRFIAFKNPFRYRGYYYDFETGLYYLNSRYYDSELARFINADNLAYLEPKLFNGLNLYSYCLNSPVINTDTTGKNILVDSVLHIINKLILKTKKKEFKNVNSVERFSITQQLFDKSSIFVLFGNFSYTVSTQTENSGLFYSYSDIGNGYVGYGFGVNAYGVTGFEFGITTGGFWDLGFVSSVSIGSVSFGSSIGTDGLGLSLGFNADNNSYSVEGKIGWGTVAFAVAVAAIPIPGTKIVAAITLFFDWLF